MRWWLPRLMTFEGTAEAGLLGGIGAVLRYERTYADYRVVAAEAAAAPAEEPVVLTRCPKDEDGDGRADDRACSCRDGRCRVFSVTMPSDTASLLDGPHLPPSIFAEGPVLVTREEMGQIRDAIERMRPPVWAIQRPTLRWTVGRQGLLRYNRVEGLSVGARADVDFAAFTTDATVRLGLADLEPRAELGFERETFARRSRIAGYHRLGVVDPLQNPFALGNTLTSLFFGSDSGDYFRATGAELLVWPVLPGSFSYRLRLFAEAQRDAPKETDWSVPRLWDEDQRFRAGFDADRADQVGAALTLGVERGRDPAGARFGAETSVEAASGTYSYVRPAITLSAGVPLPGRYRGALQVSGGTAFGDLPAQSAWYLGGTGTVRGYAPLSAGGDTFWRGRAEVGGGRPAARWVVFSDAGWAGARDELRIDPPLLSAGAGLSVLDGLVRLDVARTLRGERRWQAMLYLDGAL
jgi:hypothetical protein